MLNPKEKFDLFTIGQLMEQSNHVTLELSLLKELRELCQIYDFAQGSFNNIITSYILDSKTPERKQALLHLKFKEVDARFVS